MTILSRIEIVMLSLLLFSTGCATVNSDNVLTVAVTKSGLIMVQGRDVSVSRLPQKLRNMGAGDQTKIRIKISANASPSLIKQIDHALRLEGFRYIHYIGPKHAEAFAGKNQPTKRRAF
ncbi:MAG: biopolymer transporter ExbD [Lentisphaerae bacterium]|nr:biopolymer transporter ExbD [Lentisphaerota bacterium]